MPNSLFLGDRADVVIRDTILYFCFLPEGGAPMDRRISVGLFAMAMWGLALLPSDAIGQQKTASEQLLGTWSCLF